MLHHEVRRNPAWQALVLGLFYLACFLAAGLGSLFTMVSVGKLVRRARQAVVEPARTGSSARSGPCCTP